MKIVEVLSLPPHNEKETNKHKKKLKGSFNCFNLILAYNILLIFP